MTKEQYEKTTNSITDISHRLESILPQGNEQARRDLINLREIAEEQLAFNHERSELDSKKVK